MVSGKKTYHILVIEDNPGDYALVNAFLQEQVDTFNLVRAVCFKSAATILKDGANQFDAILLDLSLPDKSGLPLINEMVTMCLTCPIIVLTGYGDIPFSVRSLAMGVSDYIIKDDLTPAILYKSIVYSCEREKAILALAASEKNYADLFHLSPLPMWVVNLATMQFLDVNKATVEHYGYSREEFLTMTLRDIRPESEIPELERTVAENRLLPTMRPKRLWVHQLRDGRLRNVEIQTTPLGYKNIQANLVIATDVTEKLEHIRAIEAQNEHLREISWIQSHVVRAPLSRIMGLIPLITSADTNPEELKQMLGYLLTSANELDEVIRAITQKTKVAQIKDLQTYPQTA